LFDVQYDAVMLYPALQHGCLVFCGHFNSDHRALHFRFTAQCKIM